jgi:hypothetical protein
MIRKAASASLCLALSANSAFAACAGPRAEAALKIASLQQRLMVAGLACHASEDYNRFVLAHRPELQRSDDDLKAWFIANGGEAGYDAYKTKAANLAAHGPATDQNAFCASAGGDFRALAASGDLLQAAASEPLLGTEACEAPQMAEAAAPVRVARNDDAVAAEAREIPAIPYADTPPPRPVSVQVAAAAPADMQVAPQPVAASRDELAAPPPRPAARSALYWYYRRLYHSGE